MIKRKDEKKKNSTTKARCGSTTKNGRMVEDDSLYIVRMNSEHIDNDQN